MKKPLSWISRVRNAMDGRRSMRLHRQGVALISTLAILSIVTILLVAYVTSVSADRQSTQSYSQALEAQEIAQGGLAQVVGQLKAEATDPINSIIVYGTNVTIITTNYLPKNVTNVIPQRMSGVLTNPAPELANIVKISLPGSGGQASPVPFYTGHTNTAWTNNFATADSTTNLSLNGRYVSLARWNKPVLVPSDASFTPTNANSGFPAPNWILVGRQGPINPNLSLQNITDLSDSLGNTNAVLGRYAYVVYDVSGLLDANVAGYDPSQFTAALPQKGLAPWVDLTQLGISASDVTHLVQWRNATNGANMTNYYNYVTNVGATNGFRNVALGDTAFVSRQDLIQFAQQYPTITNGLPYLTTFSRQVNGPVWSPSFNSPSGQVVFNYLSNVTNLTSTPYNVANNFGTNSFTSINYAATTFALNVRIPNTAPLPTTALYTNAMGIPRFAGEPLLKYRFPLEKLALLEKAGKTGVNALTAADVTNIQKYFGLDLVSDSSGLFRHWTYPSATRNSERLPAGRIWTLSEVAKLRTPRDPDFFEILQAGILAGSIGQSARGDGSVSGDPAGNAAAQIIQIGANIIDQWDADNFPTQITFKVSNSSTLDVYGVEDLPYIKEIFAKFFINTNGATPPVTNVYPSIYMQLWNPHQTNAQSAAAFATTPTNTPTIFQFQPAPGDWFTYYMAFGSTRATSPEIPDTYFASNASGSPTNGDMTFTNTPLTGFRQPSLITNGSPLIPITGTNYGVGAGASHTIPIVGIIFPPTVDDAAYPNDNVEPWIYAEYPLCYYNPSDAKFHPYTTLAGFVPQAGTGASFGNPPGYNGMATGNNAPANTNSPSINGASYVRSDPRTVRWGMSGAEYTSSNDSPSNAFNTLSPSGANPTAYEEIAQALPFGHANLSALPYYREDLWAGNTNSGGTFSPSPYYTDLDGVQRVGDTAFSSLSPFYMTTPAMEVRPQVLNRPFNSVAELGYVFRDTPWKTLDFFSSTSADSALLDLFTLDDASAPVVAGHVNVNAAPVPVLMALLSGMSTNSAAVNTNSSAILGNSSSTNSLPGLLANALRATVTNTVTGHGPFMNRGDIVNGFMTNSALSSSTFILSANGVKSEREAVMRALGDVVETRTWNFMIDIIAQSGHYPPGTTALSNFTVTGERRYWLHIAIDRYTGQVVDQELEPVNQ